MKSDSAGAVIIGGGYSGTMIAAELARRGVRSTVVEAGGRDGRGTAYSTPEEAHLLNVIAGRMGAWADKPGDFAEAVAAEGYQPDDFVSRRRYGEYLRGILDEAVANGKATILNGEAISAERIADGWTVCLGDGSRIQGKALVLAQGNFAPEPPSFARDLPNRLFVNDPWSDEGRAKISAAAAAGGDILIVGTGLTMVDVVLSLDEAGHRGRIVALSRRGLAPRAHGDHHAAPINLDEVPRGSVRQMLRWLRRQSAKLGWRAVLDALRPHNQQLWQALGQEERRRFLRHARPWWDVHRHRIAPEVAGRIGRLVQDGRLEIVAGRIADMREENGGLGVEIRRRGRPTPGPSLSREGRYALAVNCTGPLGSISSVRDPLLSGLLEQGLARPDALDLGLEVDERSRIEGAERAWALGPLTKGKWWEITAVPDIRGQLAAVADDIAEELSNAMQS
jgi:uncharacterized NAD(P)/FAD-binding protein YdhS